jgi:signal transduction histidine kinase
VLVAGEEQERLLEALLTLARGQRGLDRRAPVDLAAVTRDVLAARGAEIAASGLAMAVTLEPALLAGDRALTERGVANLIDNALRHNVPGGAVWVTVGTESGQAVLTVANTGPDVPPAEVRRLLVPFERGGTAPSPRARPPADGDGLGLGLPIAAAIATAHGAVLTIAARPEGGGLAAELAFPAAQPARYAREAPAGAAAASPTAGHTAREADLAAAAQRLRDVHRMRLDAIKRGRYHYVVSRLTIDPDSVAR